MAQLKTQRQIAIEWNILWCLMGICAGALGVLLAWFHWSQLLCK